MLKLLAGPCVIESQEQIEKIAFDMVTISKDLKIPYFFKASFDKANRSSISGYRGPGLEKGLEMLKLIKEKFDVSVVTDVHDVYQIPVVAEVVDMIQIPAFLCRQTDMIVAAAKTGKLINVKKGQFLSAFETKNIVGKFVDSGGDIDNLILTERGTTFGYNNLVVDMRSLKIMKDMGVNVCFDATHSVQQPGGLGCKSGGDRSMVPILARAAVAVGVDYLFFETHYDVDNALCDGPNMIPLNKMKGLLENLIEIDKVISDTI